MSGNNRIYLATLHFLLQTLQGLTQWCMHSDFRGLERRSSMSLRQHCEDSRDDAMHIAAVVSRFVCPMEVRQRYQDTSRAARLFARMIADADAMAVILAERRRQQEEQPGKVLKEVVMRRPAPQRCSL